MSMEPESNRHAKSAKRRVIQASMRDQRLFAQSERTAGRPNKRERRQLHRFKGKNADGGDN